jgi:hypothetical protein
MTKDEALKMAIEVMDNIEEPFRKYADEAINACKEALEQPAQEPVYAIVSDGHIQYDLNTGLLEIYNSKEEAEDNTFIGAEIKAIDIYTHSHQWQGLTDDEINELHHKWIMNSGNKDTQYDFACAIEQALKEKNT